MQNEKENFTQSDYDDLRFELTDLEMRRNIGEEVDEKRIEEIKEILNREVGHN